MEPSLRPSEMITGRLAFSTLGLLVVFAVATLLQPSGEGLAPDDVPQAAS